MELQDDGTLDLTGLIEAMEETWVKASMEFAFAAMTAENPWMAIPIIRSVILWIMEMNLRKTAKSVEMQAFFVNTIFRKASQAKDYIATIHKRQNLSPHATEEEYEALEREELSTFRNFVRVTN